MQSLQQALCRFAKGFSSVRIPYLVKLSSFQIQCALEGEFDAGPEASQRLVHVDGEVQVLLLLMLHLHLVSSINITHILFSQGLFLSIRR